jgi:hypothetical protein
MVSYFCLWNHRIFYIYCCDLVINLVIILRLLKNIYSRHLINKT